MQVTTNMALTIILLALAWLSFKDAKDYKAFKRVSDGEARLHFFRRWTLTPMWLFGFGGLGILAVLGRMEALFALPVEFAEATALFETGDNNAANNLETLLGTALGIAMGLAITFLVWRTRLKKMRKPVGDIEALLPRNGREVAAAIPLSINAGISEEIFFRAALPMLAFVATGSMMLAFGISIAAFGLAHWYQGYKGVFATALMGVLFSFFYLSSGSLLKPILIHILIDLIALVIRPAWSIHMANRASARVSATNFEKIAR